MAKYFLVRKTVVVDTTPPTITSSNSVSNAENSVLAHTLMANETVSWSIVGGADQSKFEIATSTLRWLNNATKDYEAPNDADLNNTYIVTVRATDVAGNTTDQTITVTVTNVSEAAANAFLDFFGDWEDAATANARGGEYAAYETKFNNNYSSVNIHWFGGTGGATYDSLFWATVQYIRGGRSVSAVQQKGLDWWTEFERDSGWPQNGEPYMSTGPGLLGQYHENGQSQTWKDKIISSADYAAFYATLTAGEPYTALKPDNSYFSWRVWSAMMMRCLIARYVGATSLQGYNYQNMTRACIDTLIDSGFLSDGSLRVSNHNLFSAQVFQQGLAAHHSIVHYLNDNYRRTELQDAVLKLCNWVWSTMLDGRSTTAYRFLYIPSYDPANGGEIPGAETVALADVNGFWLMPFGWLYKQTGDPIWRTRMLNLYATMNADAGVTFGRKQFEESFCHGWQVSKHQSLSPTTPGYPIWSVRPTLSGPDTAIVNDGGTTTQTGGAIDATEYEWWYFDPTPTAALGGCRQVAGATTNTFNGTTLNASATHVFGRCRKHNAAGWSVWENTAWRTI